MYGSSRSISKLDVVGSNGNGSVSGSPGRSPRLPRSPRLGHRRNSSTSSTGGLTGSGKTLSMENIQSLNAAYATGGPMYFADTVDDPIGIGSLGSGLNPSLPKSTMTLGRAGARLPYGVRAAIMGSSPNINIGGVGCGALMPSDAIAFGGEMPNQPPQAATVPHSMRQVRDGAMSDLQTQLREVLRENELLRRELEAKESKLSSSMNSIKTFWSPELKKERALRKDEATKMSVWKEQYRVVQEETQHLQCTIQALQDEVRIQRDLNHLFQSDYSDSGHLGNHAFSPQEMTEDNFLRLHAEYERQVKELFLLRKTVEEMELRIDTQKHTLTARDESIKKLLEMLQSKGLSSRATEEDHERTRRLADAEMTIHQLEGLLERKDKEMLQLREELHRRYEAAPESTKTKALQTVIEMKDAKISSMERGLRELEEEVNMLKSNGALSSEEREEEIKQMEVYRSHSKFMKNKVEQLKEELNHSQSEKEELKQRANEHQREVSAMEQAKQDLSRKDSELLGFRTKLETLNNQFSDSKQHVDVLKESLTAKEQRAAILQTEVDALRLRQEEKESFLSKKSQQISALTDEKSTQQGEITDLKDMLDVKERKVNVLQKKIENLLDQLRDKEKQLAGLKDRVKSLQTDTSNTDTALGTLEEALAEKERIIERLKEQREREEREKGDEIESSKKELKELREKVSQLQADLADRETSVLDLKEKASSLASSTLKKDSRLKSLEISLDQKREECVKLENHLKKAQSSATESKGSTELSERISCLEQEVTRHKEDAGKAQTEVERLLEILREMENEKNDKEKKIHELERNPSASHLWRSQQSRKQAPASAASQQPKGGLVWDYLGTFASRQMKDQSKKAANLRHKEQQEKSKNAQLMEEAKKREDNLNESSQQIQDSLRHKEDRIEELEEALRESVQITTEREVVLAQEEEARVHSEKQVEDLLVAMERVKQELDVMKAKLSSTQLSLAEKEGHLTALRAERRKHLEEVLEMKQEALLAAISEKDANIALLELSSSKKKKTQEEVASLKREKDSLVQQLKQQTQNRMKLMADNYEDEHLKVLSPNTELPNNHKPSPDQILSPLLDLNQNRSKLKLYIGHLTSLCQERDPIILQDFAPPPSYQRSDSAAWHTQLRSMTREQLEAELELCEREGAELQEYANQVLQQIADRCPDILEQVVNALEDSC
ncbi:ELKS/Rab6-interacting/CAST family member 1-like isoform X1 [Hippoglossus hippoglossus]|uniref:ELKS/Rab6-interacting/CAST family member 1-like isoform X1 n=1 Tax=Hippoglossus hippoglossus TaxID=8267 RepID=UPI00148C142F|nr:ELKS/Rab6-interacting/CAST family member 1-like isoform X1 [Hippoglossus hippoglossus]XP_035003059.1 ELKS/Rab6-interacting/CAST family member 1 isoform X2 [Hippoglossus stenolepis]